MKFATAKSSAAKLKGTKSVKEIQEILENAIKNIPKEEKGGKSYLIRIDVSQVINHDRAGCLFYGWVGRGNPAKRAVKNRIRG